MEQAAVQVAIIGGTGVYDPDWLSDAQESDVATPYGTAHVIVGHFGHLRVAFLARHGAGHSVPPHRINYRANIWALWRLGARKVCATSAVGSMRPALQPGHAAVLSQFIDMTRLRVSTFFDGEGDPFTGSQDGQESLRQEPRRVVHTDFTHPYCPALRAALLDSGSRQGIRIHDEACYVCTEGPRYESAAETQTFSSWGGDLVGMTGVPEVTLAKEAGLCYAGLAMVTNLAAGIASDRLSHREVVQVMEQNRTTMRRILAGALEQIAAIECRACQPVP